MKQSLGGMAALNQWFIWRLEWDAVKGKYGKVPCAADGISRVNHIDPVNWLSYDEAVSRLATYREWTRPPGIEHTLGFSFTKNCGYWFLDVDDALSDGQFKTATAKWLYESLNGAAFEISSSGTGFHMFGRGQLPPHACKTSKDTIATYPEAAGLELYTQERGVAFGFTGQVHGNADSDHTALMAGYIIPTLFPYKHEDMGGPDALDFTSGPTVKEWRGPSDDDDLIRRAMNSQSTAATFSGKATFADLWQNNTAVLAAQYPGQSEIDMALIAQLAFWTGKDCARMERLMLRSALKREKWDERRGELTWLQLSILEQNKMPMKVLQDKPVDLPGEPVTSLPGANPTAPAEARERNGTTFADGDAQRELFAGCVYVSDVDSIYVPKREGYAEMLNQSRFKVHFGGYSFVMDKENARVSRNAWEAFTDSQIIRHPSADTTAFRPDMPQGHIFNHEGKRYLNIYVKPAVRMTPGDPAPFLDLINRLLPVARDQRILLSYLAAVVQYPGKKFKWCCVLQGAQGNGKSTVTECVVKAVGESLCHSPSSEDLGNKFNDWLYGIQFSPVNDVQVKGRNNTVMEQLKPMITESRLNIEGKGLKKLMRGICVNFVFAMNSKTGIIRDPNERRYAVFYTAQQSKEDVARDMPGNYFNQLYNWLEKQDGYAIVAHWLANVEIDPAYNPAGSCNRAPETSSECEVVEENEDEMIKTLRDFIEMSELGYRDGWFNYSNAKEMLRETGYRNQLDKRLKAALATLGYIPHPLLGSNGKSTIVLASEGNKYKCLWVLASHPNAALNMQGADIVRAYVASNSIINAFNG